MTADRKKHDAGRMSGGSEGGVGRRGLLGGAGLLLGGAAALTAGPQRAAAAEAPDAAQARPSGPTDHQATYYRLARF